MMAEMAAALGETNLATQWTALVPQIRAAFVAKYRKDDGTIYTGSQTAYALTLGMDMIAVPMQREQTAARFIAKLAADNYHLKTGFLGTPWLLTSRQLPCAASNESQPRTANSHSVSAQAITNSPRASRNRHPSQIQTTEMSLRFDWAKDKNVVSLFTRANALPASSPSFNSPSPERRLVAGGIPAATRNHRFYRHAFRATL